MENEITFDNDSNSAASSDIESGSLKSPKGTITGINSPTSNPLRRQKSPGGSASATSTSGSSGAESWSTDIERILQDIRTNAEILSQHHKNSYIKLQSQLVYFRVPLIIISAVNSVFSVGLSNYIEQDTVSTLNCLLSLSCACISSVELFLQIQKKLEVELNSYHGYYLLGTRVSAMLKLDREHREVEGITFLNSTVNEYNNLFEQSCVDSENFTDQLVAFDTVEGTPQLKGTKRKP
jgi:hypothetical protein